MKKKIVVKNVTVGSDYISFILMTFFFFSLFLFFFFFFNFLAMPHTLQDICFPNQGLNLGHGSESTES